MRYIKYILFILLFSILCNGEGLIINDLKQAYTSLNIDINENINNQDITTRTVSELASLRSEMIKQIDQLTKTKEKYQELLKIYQTMKKSDDTLSQILQETSNNEEIGPIVIFTIVTSSYLPLAKNFLCYIRSLEEQPKVLIWAIDDNAFNQLQDWTSNVYQFSQDYTKIFSSDSLLSQKELKLPIDPSSKTFQRLLLGRNRIAMEILNAGYNVLLVDIDQVWLDNPLQYIITPEITGIYSKLETGEELFSTSFLYLPSNLDVIKIWEQFLQIHTKFLQDNCDKEEPEYSLLHSEYKLFNGMISNTDNFNPVPLNRDLFADGIYYFKDKLPQLKGIRPVIIHCNLMDGLLSKRALLKRKAMWMISDKNEQCPIQRKDELLINNSNSSNPTITIKLLTYNRPSSLLRCLISLRNADYLGDTVNLDIFIDYEEQSSSFPSITLQICDEFYWPYGKKTIHYRINNSHIIQQWLEAWFPSINSLLSPSEFAFFVEDDIEVSEFYYKWLIKAIKSYYYNPSNYTRRLFGISLQKQNVKGNNIPNSIPSNLYPTNQSLLYQYPSTWGVLYSSSHWKSFRYWFEMQNRNNLAILSMNNKTYDDSYNNYHLQESLKPYIKGNLFINEQYNQLKGKLLFAWLMRFIYEKGMFYLYPNLPSRSLIINHQESGIFNKESKGPDSILLHYEEEIIKTERDLYKMYPLEQLKILNICGKEVLLSNIDKQKENNQIIC